MRHLHYLWSLLALIILLPCAASAQDEVISASWSTSPTQGTLAPAINPFGVAAFDLNCSDYYVRVNRQAQGYVELRRGTTLLAQVPAQNSQRIYTLDEFTKVPIAHTVNVNFFRGVGAPTIQKGVYTVTIPERFFEYVDSREEETAQVVGYSEAMTLTWTMPDTNNGMTIAPPTGKATSLKDFTLTFPEGTTIEVDTSVHTSTGTDEDGNPVTQEYTLFQFTGRHFETVSPEVTVDGNVIRMSLPTEVTAVDTYDLYIAPKAITYTQMGEQMTNSEIYYTYVISEEENFDCAVSPLPGTYMYFDAMDTESDKTPKAYFTVTLPEAETGKKWASLVNYPFLAPVDADGNFSTSPSGEGCIKMRYNVETLADGTQVSYFTNWNPDANNSPLMPAPGTYALVLPAKAFFYSGTTGMQYSPMVQFFYKVTGNTEAVECTIVPTPGSTLEEIKEITLTFPEDKAVTLGPDATTYATLKQGLATYLLNGVVSEEKPNEVTFAVNYVTLQTPGAWTFATPEENFQVGDGFPRLTAEYTIERLGEDMTIYVSPADEPINMEKNPNGLAAINFRSNYTKMKVNREAEGYISLYRDGELLAQVPAQNSKDLYTYDEYTRVEPGPEVQVTFFRTAKNPATEPGRYTMVIPEGFFWLGDPNDQILSPELQHQWTIAASSTSGVTVTPEAGEVTSLQTFTVTLPAGATIQPIDNTPETESETDPETGETVTSTSYPVSVYHGADVFVPEIAISGNVITLTLSEAITTPGSYWLDIAAGAIKYTLEGSDEVISVGNIVNLYQLRPAVENLPIVPEPGTYSVLEPMPCYDNSSYKNCIFDITVPAQNITGAMFGAYLYPVQADGSINKDDTSNAIAFWGRLTTGNPDENGFCHVFLWSKSGIDKTVCPEAGDYRLVIPGNKIYVSSSTELPVGHLPELTYDYTFTGADINYVITPKDEATVEAVKDVVITFPDAESVTLDSKAYATLYNGYATYVLSGLIDPATPNTVTFSVDYVTLSEVGRWEFKAPNTGLVVDNKVPSIQSVIYIGEKQVEAPTYTINPADGSTLETLDKVRVACSVRNVVKGDEFAATITDGTDTYALSLNSISNGIIVLQCPETIQKAGTWTLAIEPGSFVANDIASPLLGAVYEITGPQIVKEPEYTLNPADGAELVSIETITVTCDTTPVTVTDGFDAYLESGDRAFELHVVSVSDEGVITLAADTEVIFAGEWELYIKAASFLADGYTSPAISATYTLEGKPYEFAYSMEPANGAEVKEIEFITIKANTEDLARGSFSATIVGPANETINVSLYEMYSNTIILKPATVISTDGYWTLNVAEGSFKAEGVATPAITATFHISTSGVTLLSEDGNFDIFTATGICIKRNADINDVKTLAPGLYIINGQKVVLK